MVGGIYHVTSRGVRKSDVYRDELDRQCFLDLLAEVTERTSWLCHSYCLMTNHYHLLVRTLRPDISRAMFLLNGRFARRFNERHGFEGHVFERRFAAELIEDERHVFNTMRYIELNPVRAGICTSPADWPWSSYRAAVGLAAPPRFLATQWLLRHFGGEDRGVRAYRAFVAEGLARD